MHDVMHAIDLRVVASILLMQINAMHHNYGDKKNTVCLTTLK